jgi:preprotein translocase subunit SecD
MKISWRIWVLIFALAFALMTILNISSSAVFFVGLLTISILATLTYGKSKTIKIILIVLTIVAIILIIFFSFQKGVVITSINKDSQFFAQGLSKGLLISSINGNQVNNVEDFSSQISLDGSQESKKWSFQTNQGEVIVFTNETPSFIVSNIPKTNLKTGLDLSGGARAILRPVNVTLSQNDIDDLVSITSNRLNTFGISDVDVRSVSDLEGNRFLRVEVAGLTPDDLRSLVGQQGKFEAKIGNETVFVSGEKDITFVCRNDATCSGVETCQEDSSGVFFCRFRFSISLSPTAATRHAQITQNLTTDPANSQYLSKKLDLYLDDNLTDSLFIGVDLKGRETTQIQISGSGSGATQDDAYDDAINSMKKLQTILITGSLPYKLEILKLDSSSPALGREFTKNITLLGLSVFVIVSLIIFLKYRKLNISLSVILTMFSEALITLGIAALISWNLDAPSIAGIIAGIGTGVNDQIVIIDESVSKEASSLKSRIKRALFVIVGAFFTIFAAMIPLFWAGAGLLRGFALTTILGVTVGILITRPAFTEIMRGIGEKNS